MSTSLTMTPSIRFHLSLNVTDLARSVAFYKSLFNKSPAKIRADYAKFELDEPPLVLSLEPTARPVGGPLNHLGFRMNDMATLVAFQERLERGGIRSQREEGVECCYARQTKFWVTDPDNTLWEFYILEDDIEHRGAGQSLESMQSSTILDGEWEHRMTDPLPERFPLADASVDEVRLRGTFNLDLASEVKKRLVGEAARVLRPGGRLFVHVLVGDKELRNPALAGPASKVEFVPLQSEPRSLLEEAGFDSLRNLKFDEKPCFIRDGVSMREMQIEGRKKK